MNFLLVAVLTASTGSFVNSNTRGYQTSVMQRLDSLKQCKFAAAQLSATYTAGNVEAGAPTRGQIRCVNLETGEVTIEANFP